MALELLSGPTEITRDAVAVSVFTGSLPVWVDGMGLACVLSPSPFDYSFVQIDGVAVKRALAGIVNIIPDLSRGSNGWLARTSSTTLQDFDVLAGTLGAVLHNNMVNDVDNVIVKLHDRFLRLVDNAVQWSSFADPSIFTTEYTFPGISAGSGCASRAKGNLLCFSFSDGSVRFYNPFTLTGSSKVLTTGLTNKGIWYSPKHDIFISLHTPGANDAISIWDANAVRPAAISDPIPVPALTQGKVSRLVVRVTGAQSDPCEGERVEWSLTGVGSLAEPQSLTDADGYAYNDYLAPVTSVGSATIDAQVQF